MSEEKKKKMRPSTPPSWSPGFTARQRPGGSGCGWSLQLLAPVAAFFDEHASQPVAQVLVGAIAACTATFVAHPIEVAKLRIQLQEELQAPIAERSARARPMYRNTLQALYTVAKYDGLLAVYRGLCPNLAYQFVGNGLRLGIYQISDDLGFTLDSHLEPSIRLSAISGGVSGAVSAFASSPLFLLKTHIQLHSATAAIAVGYQHGYRTARAALGHIYRTQGVWNGLWRATSSNVLRLSVGSALQLSTFSSFKALLNTAAEGRERYLFIDTIVAAFLSSLASAPIIAFLDVLRARMYAQPSNPLGAGIFYNNLRDCISKVRQTEGLRGFTRGIGGAFLYTMTSSVITLVSWDEIKSEMEKERHRDRHDVNDYGIY